MKKKFLFLIMVLLLAFNAFALAGCDFLGSLDNGDGDGGGDEGSGGIPQIDNSVDLNEFSPTVDDDNIYIDGETYYTSTSIDLVTEIHGNYTVDRPFVLDKDNDNKRIYRNIYFYKEDFIQVLYYKKYGDLGQLFVMMSDTADQEYAEIEYTSKDTPLQINIIKQGVYDIILDVETFAIDMVKVGDIDTPVYETIKTCELKVQESLSNYSYTPMVLDVETNEYYIQKEIPLDASIGFYNASHVGNYKLTVEPSLCDTLIYYDAFNDRKVQVHVGGTYKIYFNAKTYALRLELQNPDTASYFCQVEWNKGNELTAKSIATPYLFEYEFVAQGKVNDPYVDIPSFYPKLGMKYNLTIIDVDGFVFNDMYVTESGKYLLTVNLKDFTLTVKRIFE